MSIRKFISLLFLVIFNIFILKSQVLRRESLDLTKRKVPYFELEDVNYGKIKQTDLIGKVVVLNFWGPNCGPCVEEIPELNKVVRKFKSQNVRFIGICPFNQWGKTMDKYKEFKEWLQKNEFLYTVCPVEDNKFWVETFKAKIAPTHLIIDDSGYIVYKYSGKISANDLSIAISKVLINNNIK